MSVQRVICGCVVAASAVLSASGTRGVEVLWEDDFQSYTNYVTAWYVGDDADPAGAWSVSEFYDTNVQVMRSPVSLVGNPADVGLPITRADGDQFLHTWGPYPQPTTLVSASLPTDAVTRMEELGNAQLSMDAYNSVTPEVGGWGHYVEIMALDAAPGVWSPFCFSFRLEADGKVLYYDGTSSSTYPGPGWQELADLSAVYEPNQWDTIDFDLDFATDKVAVTLGGATVSGLSMAGGDLNKIQTLVLWVPGDPGPLYARAAFDNFKLTSVPEPSTVALLIGALVGLGACTWRRRRK
jgi:hypothetical protein